MWAQVAAPFLLSLVLCATVSGVSVDVENGVYVLGDETFDTVVSKFPSVMVKFYAPWCGHCKKLAPDFEKAARKLKKKAPSETTGARLAKVDATIHTKLGEKFEVKSYPTLLVFQAGALFGTYQGGRDKDDLVGYMSAMVTEPAALGMVLRWYSIAYGVYKEALRMVGLPGGIRKYLFKAFPVVVCCPVIIFLLFACMPKRKGAKSKKSPSDKKTKRPGRSDSPAPAGKDEADGSKASDKEPKAEEEKKDD